MARSGSTRRRRCRKSGSHLFSSKRNWLTREFCRYSFSLHCRVCLLKHGSRPRLAAHVLAPRMKISILAAPLGLTLLFSSACSLIAPYDRAAYEHATNAKVDTLALMSKATGSYDEHEKEVEALVRQLDKAYEYDRGRQLNKITIAQWNILSSTLIAEKKKQVGDALEQIIQLESGKLK